MRQIDKIHLAWPFYGSRRIAEDLTERGQSVNRKRVQRLMRQMGIRALYPRQRTSQPGKGHTIYPYLLRNLVIECPNQVWASERTFGWLNRSRRLSKDFEGLCETSETWVRIAMLQIMVRRLAKAT